MVAQLHKCAKKMKIFAGLGRPKTPMPSASPRRDHHFGTLTLTLTLTLTRTRALSRLPRNSSMAVGTAKGSVAASFSLLRERLPLCSKRHGARLKVVERSYHGGAVAQRDYDGLGNTAEIEAATICNPSCRMYTDDGVAYVVSQDAPS